MIRCASLALAAWSIVAASPCHAQPQIVSLGNNGIVGYVTEDGTKVHGMVGASPTRWDIAGASITTSSLDGSRNVVGATGDGAFLIGTVPNTSGVGGLPDYTELAARWSSSTGWVHLGAPVADESIGVSGYGNSGGELSTAKAISATGRFVVGQLYIAPDWVFYFRPWVWDADANGGAGEMRVLPTTYSDDRARYRDGRALDVSADGSVIVGGEDPSFAGLTEGGRPVVWRRNAMTGQYDMSYLPDGHDPVNDLPVFRTVDDFLINDAGTIIVGTTYEFDAGLGAFNGPMLARWTWDSAAGVWNRHIIGGEFTVERSWYTLGGECPIPEFLSPTAMTEDGNTIVGLVHQSTCGSFLRSAFIWTASDGQIRDLQDHLTSLGTIGIASFASPGSDLPPRLGSVPYITGNGQYLSGCGVPIFSTPGPAWVLSMAGGGACVPPFITASPEPLTFSRCGFFTMQAGAGGSLDLTFQWKRDGTPLFNGYSPTGSFITGANEHRLEITGPTPDDAGIYTCEVTGTCGSIAITSGAEAAIDPAVTPQANDTCASATDVGEGQFSFSPCGAFYDDIPFASCTTGQTTADVWYRYTPTFTGDVRLETCGAYFDSVLTVLDDCLGNEIACNDDFAVGPQTECYFLDARIGSMPVVEGVPVLIRVSAIGSFFFGTPQGRLTIVPAPPPPANDTCFGAESLTVGAHGFDTSEANTEAGVSCNPGSGRDLWYSFTAPSAGDLTVTTCGETYFDTVLSVHQTLGLCGEVELACNDDTADFFTCYSQSTVTGLSMVCGETVLIRLAGSTPTQGGAGVLNISFSGPVCRCDWNHEGGLDSQDYFDFIESFLTGDADINCADGTDSQDFFDFLDCFFDPGAECFPG